MAQSIELMGGAEVPQTNAEIGASVGRTVLELVAQPVEAFGPMPLEGRQPTSQPSQERTWDPQYNQPDSRPDVVWD